MSVNFLHMAANLKYCLVEIRYHNGWTQKDLAQNTQVSVMAIRRYEYMTPTKTIDLAFLDRLAGLMGITLWTLLAFVLGRGTEAIVVDDSAPFLQMLKAGNAQKLAELGRLSVPAPNKAIFANELLRMAEVYLKAARLEQLEMLLDMSRRALVDDTSTNQSQLNEFYRVKLSEYRKEVVSRPKPDDN